MFAIVPRYLSSCSSLRPALWNKTTSVLYNVSTTEKTNYTSNRQYHDVMGDVICPSQVMGISHLRDPRLNKGLAFTLEERQTMGIHGLLPARFKSQEEQLELCRLSLSRYQEDLNKYLYLTELQDRNEKLFYRLITEDVAETMPIVYTPTVGLACQKFGLIYRRPRGLFINIHDRGHVYDVIKNWPEFDVRAVCVTDGERILGLGDLGACGMGIPVGKLALYTALAGIKPHQCLPITLDVGTNNQSLLEDPLYIGVRHKRVTGKDYDDFIEEFMQAIVKRYGQNTLIQFEDFANQNAFRFLAKYRDQYCTFNDDIQGTAGVALSGLLAAGRVTGKKISEEKILFFGAGEASLGIAHLTLSAMVANGLTQEQAQDRIWLIDINGLLTKDRTDLHEDQKIYAKNVEPSKNLEDIVNSIKPTILIGASAVSGAFTHNIIKAMASFNERPIIFALSNPTSKAECTPQDVYEHTEGRGIYSSGSPFPPVVYKGKTYTTGQGNNAYIFPGVALGVICTGIHHIKDEVFLLVACELSMMVTEEHINNGSLFPPLSDIRDISVKLAMAIADYAYNNGFATVYPEPKDKKAFIEGQMYDYYYGSSMPASWNWPEVAPIQTRPMDPVKKHGTSKN